MAGLSPAMAGGRDDASPYDSLARAKAILRESTEHALLERRRREKQLGLQSSMLEYAETARRLRQSQLGAAAMGPGDRRPDGGPAEAAALAYELQRQQPRKGRSPLRASEAELRRLRGLLEQAPGGERAGRPLPALPPAAPPAKRRGQGTDYWDVVTKDGTVKRVVILRTDDRPAPPRQSQAQRSAGRTVGRDAGGLVNHRSDGSLQASSLREPGTSTKGDELCPDRDSEGVRSTGYHPGILPRPGQNNPAARREAIKIEVSLPRMEMETPSPQPSEAAALSATHGEEDAFPPQEERRVCPLPGGVDAAPCRARVKQGPGGKRNETAAHPTPKPMRVATHTYPTQRPRFPQLVVPAEKKAEKNNRPESAAMARARDQAPHRPELSRSSLGLGDSLAYQRAFTVNAGAQSLPERMEGILKNAVSSARGEPAGTGRAPSQEPAGAVLTGCRHAGQTGPVCRTCRAVDEIQRRLRAARSYQRDLQTGSALSRSSRRRMARRLDQPRVLLLPRLVGETSRSRERAPRNGRRRRPVGGAGRELCEPSRPVGARSRPVEGAGAGTGAAAGILKARAETDGCKKSVRFSGDDVYDPMPGYHPGSETENIISAS